MGNGLTEKERLFAEARVAGYTHKRSLEAGGYSVSPPDDKRAISIMGSKIAKRPIVAAYMDQLRADRAEKSDLKPMEIIKILEEVILFDPLDFVKEEISEVEGLNGKKIRRVIQRQRRIKEISKRNRLMIKEMKVGPEGLSFVTISRKDAAELLLRHHGLLSDRVVHSVDEPAFLTILAEVLADWGMTRQDAIQLIDKVSDRIASMPRLSVRAATEAQQEQAEA